MILSDLSADDISGRLRSQGLAFRCGPFAVRVISPIAVVRRALCLLYADHELVEPDEFVDYHLELKRPAGLRRWIKPLVQFNFDGNHPFNPLILSHAHPLFEWALNWSIAAHAHQYLILHAAVVERGGCGLIMPGPPGSGKSTLTAALISRGWRLLSDEMALIDVENSRLVPLPRPISLKNQSIDIIRRFVPRAVFSEVTHNTSKGAIAHMKVPPEHVRRSAEIVRIGWIVFPRYAAGARATLLPRSKAGTVMHLGRNSFNYYAHGCRGFETLAGLVDSGECYDFEYGDLDEALVCFDRLTAPGDP